VLWSPLVGAGGAGVPLALVLLFAGRRLVTAVELVLRMQHTVVMERERRTTLIDIARVLPSGGAVVQYERGQPQWAVWIPAAPPPAALPEVPALGRAA
jgi:hypothetical protein